MNKRNLFLVLALVPVLLFAQTKKPIVASDLMKIATANQIQISPDGSKAVMVVTRKAVKNDNEYYYTRHLYLLDLVGRTEPTQLTFGDKNDDQPQWSPDGKHIAFVRTESEKSQVWLLPLSGGEAHAITKSEYKAARPRWSPDGKKILYSTRIPFYAIEGKTTWSYERPGRTQDDEQNFKSMKTDEKKKITTTPDGTLEEVRSWLAKNTSDGNPRVLNRQDLQGELNLQPDEEFAHVFVQTIGSEDQATQVTSGFQDFQNPDWSPDGKTVICHSRIYKIHPDREQDNDLWIIDMESKSVKEFLTLPGYSASNPSYSPDGTLILFSVESTQNRHAAQNQLAIVSSNGVKPQIISTSLDRDVSGAVWSSYSKTIYFTSQSDGDIPIFSVPSKGGAITKVMGNDNGVNDFDVVGEKIVYAIIVAHDFCNGTSF